MKPFFKIFKLFMLFLGFICITSGNYLVDEVIQEGPENLNTTEIAPEIESESETETKTFRGYCDSCKWVVALFKHYLKRGFSEEHILNIGTSLCISMKLQTSAVCESGTHLFGKGTMQIAKQVNMSAAEVCYFVLGDFCAEADENPAHQWNISFPSYPKPKVQAIETPIGNGPKLKVLHLADTHYDPWYVEGSNANCREPLCCRKFDDHSNDSTSAAGKWGAFKCDLPKQTLEHLLDHIMETHKDIDYVIWTGDLAPHDVWNQTNEDIMMIIEDHVKLMSDKLSGISVFPSVGNHERAPANLFPSVEQDSSIEAFYDDIDTLWSRWLPINTSSTLRHGAFYSTLVRSGFRIISLNMNVCSNLNLWLLLNSTDPLQELQWLINELQQAEIAKEKVHIIGHIPPGYMDCIKTWSHNYYEIIARYEHTVTAQFFGHTHFDEFEVFYDPKNLSRAINVAYIGPSVTPYTNLNPAYRIYYIDGDHKDTTRSVFNHETWTMNLEEANLMNQPIWRKSYSAKDAYSMDGLRPNDWSELISNMEMNDELFDLYFRNYWRDSPLRPLCTPECRNRLLCQAKSGRSRDKLTLCQNSQLISKRVDISSGTSTNIDDAGEKYDQNGQTSHRIEIISIAIAVCRILMPSL